MESRLDLPHKAELQNLQKFFQTAVRWPRTLPIILKLIKLPANQAFDLWFGMTYFLHWRSSERRNPWTSLRMALANWKQVLART